MNGPRFSIIPAGAIFDRSLEARDLQVIGLLGCHTDKAGWCSRSQVKMARELNCSRGTVQNSLDRLCDAGWVEKKRRDVEVEEAGKHPSRAYAYRVLLDRDDFALESVTRDADDDEEPSHAETASEGAGCQQVGTPTVPTDQHPGANPSVSTGANTCDGTKNVPLERPLIERERDARARDRKARFIAAFEQRWPTAAADDRQRTGYAAEALSEDEERAALDGIGPFLEKHRQLGRKHVPAGWNYLEQKRWTLLEQPKAEAAALQQFELTSREGRAVAILYEIAGKTDFFFRIICRGRTVYTKIEMTPQMLALADLPPRKDWTHQAAHNEAGAWKRFAAERLGELTFRIVEGASLPKPFPPKVDGTWSPTGPPSPTEDDFEALANEGRQVRERC